ncbi:MAG TPA: hypothetical protein VFI47_10945 [Acidimicrobiales bacterium]|nr:hypothetical protein [Acidimicrobiales bacterium]
MSFADEPDLAEPRGDGTGDDDEEFRPVGTVTFLALYAVVLVVLWLAMYLTMLARGGTA